MMPALTGQFGNQSSATRPAGAAAGAAGEARGRATKAADMAPADVIFASGAMGADSLELYGLAAGEGPSDALQHALHGGALEAGMASEAGGARADGTGAPRPPNTSSGGIGGAARVQLEVAAPSPPFGRREAFRPRHAWTAKARSLPKGNPKPSAADRAPTDPGAGKSVAHAIMPQGPSCKPFRGDKKACAPHPAELADVLPGRGSVPDTGLGRPAGMWIPRWTPYAPAIPPVGRTDVQRNLLASRIRGTPGKFCRLASMCFGNAPGCFQKPPCGITGPRASGKNDSGMASMRGCRKYKSREVAMDLLNGDEKSGPTDNEMPPLVVPLCPRSRRVGLC